MLEFPYFRFSPLKPFLFRGLMLKEDKEFSDATEPDTSPFDNSNDQLREAADESKARQQLRDLKVPQCKKAYIGLKEFAKYLSVFNRKTPIDLKIKCKLRRVSVVYFRMFDTDGDRKITERDLNKVLTILAQNNGFTEEERYTVIKNMMSETSENKGYIDHTGSLTARHRLSKGILC
eukprot:TRINITY_DN9047_c0_g2_i2.p1 TRINITY_DN9047_c0_g2~~TRINITY_DN9047_c0_g2_i2.p1  ORF type:complete len:177 (-),score=23.54 TRINITY_DN9047_c0_g2_i2:183-713(-)